MKKPPLIALTAAAFALVVMSQIKNSSAKASQTTSAKDDIASTGLMKGGTPQFERLLVIGDSQVGRNIGPALEASFRNKMPLLETSRWFKEGTTPTKILKDSTLKSTLLNTLSEFSPDFIIIQLGDNGLYSKEDIKSLANLIINQAPKGAFILWSGPQPLGIPKNINSSYVTIDPSRSDEPTYFDNYNLEKDKWFKRLREAIEELGSVALVDPRDFIGSGSFDIKTMSTDGVHIDKEAAEDYANALAEEIDNSIGGI